MKKTTAVVVMLLGMTSQACAKRAGYLWFSLSKDERIAYAAGYRDGMQFAYLLALEACQKTATPECQTMTQTFGTSFNALQIADGIDEFYKDFRNKDIPMGAAAGYVWNELLGMTDAELADTLQKLRALKPK